MWAAWWALWRPSWILCVADDVAVAYCRGPLRNAGPRRVMLGGVGAFIGDYVWFLPGVVVTLLVSTAASVWLGGALDVRPVTAWALMVCLGVILSATLTPS